MKTIKIVAQLLGFSGLFFSCTQLAMLRKTSMYTQKCKKLVLLQRSAKLNSISVRSFAQDSLNKERVKIFQSLLQRRSLNFSRKMINTMIQLDFSKELKTKKTFEEYCSVVLDQVDYHQRQQGQEGCSLKDFQEMQKMIEDYNDFELLLKLLNEQK